MSDVSGPSNSLAGITADPLPADSGVMTKTCPYYSAMGQRKILLAIFGLWLLLYASFALFRPALLDDADSVHAEVAREMVVRHDWITLHANGIRYLEKAPLMYWSMAASFSLVRARDLGCSVAHGIRGIGIVFGGLPERTAVVRFADGWVLCSAGAADFLWRLPLYPHSDSRRDGLPLAECSDADVLDVARSSLTLDSMGFCSGVRAECAYQGIDRGRLPAGDRDSVSADLPATWIICGDGILFPAF